MKERLRQASVTRGIKGRIGLPLGIGALALLLPPVPALERQESSRAGRTTHAASRGAIGVSGMVASGQRLASEAGVAILRAGGNAVDAAIATAFVLGVVDVGNAGLGGGGSILIWDAESRRAEYAEFYSRAGESRGTAGPAKDVAIPGMAAGLLEAHQRFGKLQRGALLAPALELARDGFCVPVNLASTLAAHQKKILTKAQGQAVGHFYPGGKPLQAGDLLVQPEKAAVLRRIAAKGLKGFSEGAVARAIVEALNEGGCPATLEDFSGFRPRWQRPLAGRFRDFTVLGSPPPMGGTQVVQALVLLDPFPLARHGLPAESAASAGLIVDALRIASRDHRAWVHDPALPVPAAGLVSRSYARDRKGSIGQAKIPRSVPAGKPWEFERRVDGRLGPLDPWPPSTREGNPAEAGGPGPDEEAEEEQTTHLSVVDRHGNAVALSMTLGPSFGSGFYTSGIFFNNALTRFGSSPAGNRWAPGRTPRSDLSPTIVLEGDRVRLVTGAQGGTRIPGAVLFNVLYCLEFGLPAAEAMAAPRAHPFHGSAVLRVEAAFEGQVLAEFRKRGFNVEHYRQQDSYFAGAHLILVAAGGTFEGAADLRRGGWAAGY